LRRLGRYTEAATAYRKGAGPRLDEQGLLARRLDEATRAASPSESLTDLLLEEGTTPRDDA
jgi:hypothetical protein